MKPFNKACADAHLNPKVTIDDRVIIRRETGGLDLVTDAQAGCDDDDDASLQGYAVLKNAGFPVKLAGSIMSRVRAKVRDYPDEPLQTVVLLANGSSFVIPTSMIDLSSGYTSGSFVVCAMTIDWRNLRQRAREASEVEDAA